VASVWCRDNSSLYFRRENRIYVITHVNDFKVIDLTRIVVDKVKEQLMGKFDIKD
jgi:hypothetical protein